MMSNILMGVILALFVIIVVLLRGRKTEKLTACPAGCVSTNPDPCPYGYKLNPTTNQCAPQPNIPK
jgi:hypothetical protein